MQSHKLNSPINKQGEHVRALLEEETTKIWLVN